MAFINIKIRLFAYDFKNNVFYLEFNLSICHNSFIIVILGLYLASFNYHLTGNIY